jgi:hypothetical protein
VQLDQVLDTFDQATRDSLGQAIGGLSRGLGGPTGQAGLTDSELTGAASLREAARALDGALVSVTHVAQDVQGTAPGDLRRAIRGSRNVTAQLAQSPAALAGLVTDFDTVMGSLASRDEALSATVERLDALVRAAPPGLDALDEALPELQDFAERLRPVLRTAPAPLRTTTRFARQIDRIVAPAQLPALLDDLAPVSAALPQLERRLGSLLPLVTRASRCLGNNVLPTLNEEVPDGPLSTGDPVWLDALHLFSNVASFTGGFDGNGSAARAGVTENATVSNSLIPGLGAVTNFGPQFKGVRPTWLGYGVDPAYRPDQWCDQQPLPDLSQRSGPPPGWNAPGATAPSKGGR